jgi:hypothetical protein
VGKAHWPPALSRVNKRALMLAKGGALALVTSGVVRLKLPNEKEPEQVFVGAYVRRRSGAWSYRRFLPGPLASDFHEALVVPGRGVCWDRLWAARG